MWAEDTFLVPVRVLKRLVSAMPLTQNAKVPSKRSYPPERVKEWIQLGIPSSVCWYTAFNRKQSQRLTHSKHFSDIHEILNVVRLQLFNLGPSIYLAYRTSHFKTFIELDTLLAIKPPHVSLYGLTYEPRTPFHSRLKQGLITPISDDIWAAQFCNYHPVKCRRCSQYRIVILH